MSSNPSPIDADTLPSRYVHRLFEVAEAGGVDLSAFLATHDIDREWLSDKNNSVSHRFYLAAIDAVLERSEDPDVGLIVGQRTSLVDHGVLGYAVLASATLRKGLNRFSRFQQILGPMISVSLDVRSGEAVITGEEVFPLGAKYRFAVSSWAAETNQIRTLFDDTDMKFSMVRLALPAGGAEQRYEDLLECKVLFDQKVNAIHFPAEYLDAPISLADRSVAELCVQQCERILGRLDEKTVLVDKVRRVIMARPGEIPSIDDVAEKVNMSSRSLRRHLKQASTSFTEIVNDVRMNMAAEYLVNTHLPPKEIGYLVGYSEVAAFHRAFRRHFSVTPNTYRADPYSAAR